LLFSPYIFISMPPHRLFINISLFFQRHCIADSSFSLPHYFHYNWFAMSHFSLLRHIATLAIDYYYWSLFSWFITAFWICHYFSLLFITPFLHASVSFSLFRYFVFRHYLASSHYFSIGFLLLSFSLVIFSLFDGHFFSPASLIFIFRIFSWFQVAASVFIDFITTPLNISSFFIVFRIFALIFIFIFSCFRLAFFSFTAIAIDYCIFSRHIILFSFIFS